MPETASSSCAQVPVGLLTCQATPYLKQLKTTVLDCSQKPNKQKLYEVHLQDTGGQPCDFGTINEVEVKNVQRVGTSHVHHTTAPIPVGSEVLVKVDWTRRFDNMQQHSGQHLVSALFEQPEYGCDTVAWGMNDKRCHVELNKVPTQAQIQEVEQRLNLYIRRDYPVHITFTDQKPATLPADYVGPNGVFRVAEIMEDLDLLERERLEDQGIDPVKVPGAFDTVKGMFHLDFNPCCGTHVRSLKDVQAIKLLHTERVRGGNCRLFFVCGSRALTLLEETYTLSREMGTVLQAPGGLETFVDTIVRTQKSQKDMFKQLKVLWREIAVYQIKEWIQLLEESKAKSSSSEGEDEGEKGRLITLHREDADVDYLTLLASLLQKDYDLVQGKRIFVLSTGDRKEGGAMTLLGKDEDLIKKVAAAIQSNVDIKGGGKGRWQGKASKSWDGLDAAWQAARAIVEA
ncbi:hypothetical protein DFQ27_002382 [Actinomortierella ambigua]|uniref:Threonyl/alanyl tRNA synthetase SAD domain-containing protein n=1 Tax=Actinomortierella ambigua TaxID=1343610 RepID=A0A9P6QJQ0_9FUNG|nr:hypothetical protein DFQ27_002382 [Actinomortierella ambigua]